MLVLSKLEAGDWLREQTLLFRLIPKEWITISPVCVPQSFRYFMQLSFWIV
jgi:hypothetical protein